MTFFVLLWVTLFAGVSVLGSFLKANRPSKSRVRNDIDSIRKDLKSESKTLAPWTKEEIELFSHNKNQTKRRRGWSPNYQGHFTNIYHEKVLIYYLKQYGARGRNAVLIARNANNEYVYNISKDGIEIYIDEHYLGFLRDNGELYNTKKRQKIGHLDRSSGTTRDAIRVDDRIIGFIINSTDPSDKVKQRAFEVLSIENERIEKIFLALAFFDLITQEI